MASRRSRRGKKKGGKGFLVVIAAIVIAGGAGGWYMLGGNDKNSNSLDASISGILPGMGDTEGSDSAPQETQSLAEVERLLHEVNTGLATADGDEREETLRDGYTRLAQLLENPLPIEERSRAIELFHSITDELFMSSVHNEFSDNYVVQSGDSYDMIARKYRISTNLLYDLNNRPRGKAMLHPNDNLKVPKGSPKLVVKKRDFTASVYFGDYLVRQYIIAHGRNNNTPVGSTTIASMTVDPEKSARGPNDPRGEMKLRWIGLDKYAGDRSGFGFHGTQYPDSIPGMSSAGCIRMHDEDVVELYDIVRIGNKVEVKA